MRIIKLTIEYDGTGYVGWQVQPNGISIQQVVEAGLEKVVGLPVRVVSSGRTDAGVHARGMVAHFRTDRELPLSAFREGVNSHLPESVAIVSAEEVAADFHSRYSALAKRYRYSINQGEVRSPIAGRYSWHVKRQLDLQRMRQAAELLLGEHDFRAFRSSGCDAKTSVREIYAINIKADAGMIHVDIVGNGFLRNMVRIIVGTLVEVGSGARSSDGLPTLLAQGERGGAGKTAPAQGLCLMQVWYDGNSDDWTGRLNRGKSSQKSLDKQL
ncbi:MAG: tRNA pseudouridine(38-40) synthase TruA [Desulfuromonas sp.]|nr:MAG: tRNA pseudouridine(38-40) synthase TruA [Desulfuromonas sp.]